LNDVVIPHTLVCISIDHGHRLETRCVL
jgi:hypothetical protein